MTRASGSGPYGAPDLMGALRASVEAARVTLLTTQEAADRGLPTDRRWVADAAVTCMDCQRAKNRMVCRCGNPTPPAPASARSGETPR